MMAGQSSNGRTGSNEDTYKDGWILLFTFVVFNLN